MRNYAVRYATNDGQTTHYHQEAEDEAAIRKFHEEKFPGTKYEFIEITAPDKVDSMFVAMHVGEDKKEHPVLINVSKEKQMPLVMFGEGPEDSKVDAFIKICEKTATTQDVTIRAVKFSNREVLGEFESQCIHIKCPQCGKEAGVEPTDPNAPRITEPGSVAGRKDYMVCDECLTVVGFDKQLVARIVSNEEIAQQPDEVMENLMIIRARYRQEKARRKQEDEHRVTAAQLIKALGVGKDQKDVEVIAVPMRGYEA